MTQPTDRNFDDLAERFSSRVYGKLKGEIRQAVIWRDLTALLPELTNPDEQPISVLDLGGGLGQFSIRLAALGHQVTYNDISETMTSKAKTFADEAGVKNQITWYTGSYQSLVDQNSDKFDLILCHALIEWLAEPEQLIVNISQRLKSKGQLSLCFYNPAGRIYRNLIFGNFKLLNQEQPYQTDKGTLTPTNPSDRKQVLNWLAEANLEIETESGIRVFSDYVLEKRGGHQSQEDVLSMELKYSNQEPYKGLGRYLHMLCKKS